MRKEKCELLLFLFITATFVNSVTTRAQVTIGSSIEPNQGVLLDLKEEIPDSDNQNSKRGLLLPRVNLSEKNNLYPMFTGDADYSGNVNGKKTTEDDLHIGLTVYNLNKCDGFGVGTYVWQGQEWEPLMDVEDYLRKQNMIVTASDNVKVIDDNTIVVNYPSGKDLRSFPADGKFNFSLDWLDPNNGELERTAINHLGTTDGANGGLGFLNNTDPENWTNPVTTSPVAFGFEMSDMSDIIGSDNPMIANPFRSRETAITYTISARECYAPKQVTVKLNQTNLRFTIKKNDNTFNNFGLRFRTGNRFGKGRYYYRFLITYNDPWDYDKLVFDTQTNARWNSTYNTTTSGIISDINIPGTGGKEIIDGAAPEDVYFAPQYVADTDENRFKEAGVLLFTDTAASQRYFPVEVHLVQCRVYNYEQNRITDVGYDPNGDPIAPGSGILRHKDQDGRSFLSAEFGAAGRWMITNLAAMTFDTQSPRSGETLIPFTETTLNDHDDGAVKYAYPQTNDHNTEEGASVGWDTPPSDWQWEEGIYYNWYAATGRGFYDNEENDEGYTDQAQMQGICPNGWHIPSDKEWSELEEVIFNNIRNYSTYDTEDLNSFGSPTWDPAWNTTTDFRATTMHNGHVGHGSAMMSACPVKGGAFSYMTATTGYSREPNQGGFSGSLVGRITGDRHGTPSSILTQKDRGWNVDYWTCSQDNIQTAWLRGLALGYGNIERQPWDKTRLISVRCKKNQQNDQ